MIDTQLVLVFDQSPGVAALQLGIFTTMDESVASFRQIFIFFNVFATN